jgi:hypothetical protein
MLIDPPKGIYITGELEPVIKDDLEYYTLSGNNYVIIKDINTVTGHVYNSDYKLIVPGYMMKNKEKFLSNQPTLPYMGTKIFDSLINDYIYTSLSYNNLSFNQSNPFNHDIIYILSMYILDRYKLVPNIMNDILDKCYRSCVTILNDIDYSVLCGNEWIIHRSYISNTTLIIEKYCDWRVYDWYRLQEKDICD